MGIGMEMGSVVGREMEPHSQEMREKYILFGFGNTWACKVKI